MTKNYFKKAKVALQLFTIAMSLFVFKANAQCPPGNVTFSTQAQVDQFAVDYPFCTQINGYMTVSGSNISNLNGLSNLASTVGSLDITQNPLLTDISGLSNITSVGQDLAIRNNAVLQSIVGLSNINTVGDGLLIQHNPQLQALNALQSITTVTGALWIIGNPQLQSLNGLQNIVQVGGDVDVTNNAVLNNITALQNIDPTSITQLNGYGLTILDNPNVSACSLSNFCTYLTYDPTTHPRDISGNAGDCISEAALLAVCNLAISDVETSSLSYYPNPVKEVLSFSEEVSNVKITDISGRTVKQFSKPGKSVDLSNLSKGVYIMSATTEEGKTVIKKIMKE